MNEKEERIYMRGQRGVYRELLGVALRGLSVNDAPNDLESAQKRIAALESELADARVQLRMLCDDFGDNEWEDDLHIADVIDKHLGRYLHGNSVATVGQNAAISDKDLELVSRASESPLTPNKAAAYRKAEKLLSKIAFELLARRRAR